MTAAWQSFSAATAVSGGDPVVTKPDGTVDGDLLIAYAIATAGHTVTLSGKTPRVESVGVNGPLWIWQASSEPADYMFEVTGGLGNCQAVIYRVTGHDPTNPIDVVSGFSGTGVLVIPSVTPTGLNRLVMQAVAKNSNTTFTPPGTATERWDALASPNNFGSAGGDEILGAAPTGTRTWTPSSGSSTPGIGYMVAIAPAPPPPIVGDVAGTTVLATATLVGAIGGVLAASTILPTAALTGTYEPPAAVSGNLAGATPAATATLTGVLDGVIAAQTPTVLAALAGGLPGTLDGTAPAATAAIVGSLPGSIAGQSGVATAELVGSIAAVMAPSTPSVQGAFAGTYTPPDEGSGFLAATTPATVADLEGGYVDPPGTLAGATPATTGTLVGSLPGQLAGDAPKTTAALAGAYNEPAPPGTLDGAAPGPPTAALVGAIVGALEGTTPRVTAQLSDVRPHSIRISVIDVSPTYTLVDVSRTLELADKSRTVTIEEV